MDGNRTGLVLPGVNVCIGSNMSMTAQLNITDGSRVTILFPDGTPPFILSGAPRRDGKFRCQVHKQNLDTNEFVWIVESSTNGTALNLTSGDLAEGPNRNSTTPIFQIGDSVQWTAHEVTPRPDGRIRYFQSGNYTITREDGSVEPDVLDSGALRLIRPGIVGWVIGGLLLSMVAAMG